MALLSVFANFRIDSEERLLRMQDSFRSFCDADIEKWVINIRGPFKQQAAEFLEKSLGDKPCLFDLESIDGWFYDSSKMLHEISSEYVFFWIEDHICLSGVDYFNQVVSEMKAFKADYLLYSAFHNGTTLKSYNCLPTINGNSIITVNYDIESHRKRLEYIKNNKMNCPSFVISACSIQHVSLFKRNILTNDPEIKRWPIETPFDFEKNQHDIHWLPINIAQTKSEFFAFIDDDQGTECHCLISRGLYPDRVSRDTMLKIRNSNLWNHSSLSNKILLKFHVLLSIISKFMSTLLRRK